MRSPMLETITKGSFVSFLKHFSRRQKVSLTLAFLALFLLLNKTYESTTYAFFSYASASSRSSLEAYAIPTFVNIPSVEIALPVDETTISHGFWTISDDGASHLASTPVPGERGNVVIYAKNTPESFGRLTSLKPGDTIILDSKDGSMHEYVVSALQIVSPTDAALINNTTKETLTLYTAYGFADLKRFVVRAIPATN